jgi:hypothetical protein
MSAFAQSGHPERSDPCPLLGGEADAAESGRHVACLWNFVPVEVVGSLKGQSHDNRN